MIDFIEKYPSIGLLVGALVTFAIVALAVADKSPNPDKDLFTMMVLQDVPTDSIAYALKLPRKPVVDFVTHRIVKGSQYLCAAEDLSVAIIFTFNDSLPDMLAGQVVFDTRVKKKPRGP